METRLLLAFVAVAEERHFGRAAERLGMSQPPLSRQIQQLEAALGTKLLARTSRSVELTRAGTSYLAAIRPLLDGLERAADVARIASRQLTGKVRVGMINSLIYRLVPSWLAALRKAAPGLAVELFEQAGPEQVRALRERRLDLGLLLLPVDDQGLQRRVLYQERLVAMLPAKHRLAGAPQVHLAKLAKEPFILCPHYQQTSFHETVLNACRAAGFEPVVNHETASKSATAELVAAGLGVTLVPASAADHQHSGVVYRPLGGTVPSLQVAAVWLEEAMTPALRLCLDQVVQVALAKANELRI